MLRYLFSRTISLQLCFFFCLAILAPPREARSAESHFAITREVAQRINDGQHFMYNGDYGSAEREFDALIRLYPDHPVGYMYRAVSVWWRCLDDKNNKVLQTQFLDYTAKGIALGEALLEKDPKDFHAQMFLAGIYGNQTRFYVTITRSRLAAMRSGMKGNKYNRSALALKPDCYDCMIGTGTYCYAPEALPPLLRQMAAMLGVRGDKSQSLKDLEIASQKGEFAQTEAKLVLLGIYYNEKWYGQFEKLSMDLIHQYPANHILYSWLTDYYIELHRYDDGIHFYANHLAKTLEPQKMLGARGYALMEKARLELGKKAAAEAASSLSLGIEAAQNDPGLLAKTHLLRGFALDMLNQRQAALREYQAVLTLPNIDETHKKASLFSKDPYQGKP